MNIRIGTRNSELALWQAHLVQKQLNNLGYKTTIVEISSTGDEVLDKPLHQIGGMGLFTKTLDTAMLRREIDIAVHSLKDVPTDLPNGIVQAAVLKRASVFDALLYKESTDFLEENNAVIATGSLRRKAQWLNKFPNHIITGLRGNVNTRLQKLEDNNWNGAIFAAAGLQRVNLLPENHIILDWMIPAPAQGAIMITALEKDKEILQICSQINNEETEITVAVEREFMKTLEGGCTAPIGAIATIKDDVINFRGILISLNGDEKIEVERSGLISDSISLGKTCAEEILKNGGKDLMKRIKAEMQK